MKTMIKKLLLTAFALTLPLAGARAINPDISNFQKAVSVEPPGQFENSLDGQIAVVGQTVHLTYFSNAKLDPWTSTSTNRLYYRRSLDGGQTFQPPVLLSETPDTNDPTAVILFPYGGCQSLAVDGANVHVLSRRSSDVGGWHFVLDYFRSTNSGASFEAHPALVVSGTYCHLDQPMIVADQGKVSIAYRTWQNWDNHTWVGSLHSTDAGATFFANNLDLWAWPGGGSVGFVGLTRSGNHVAMAWQNDYWNCRNAYVAASTNGGTNFTVTLLNDVNAGGYGGVAFQDSTGSDSGGGAIRPKLAWMGQNLYAVWTGIFTNDNSVLRAFMARSTNGGATFLPQQCLSLDMPASAGGLTGGHITVAAKANFVYALFNTDNDRLFLKRSSDRGATFEPIQEIGDVNSTTASGGWWNLIQTDPNVADGSKVHLFTSDYYRVSMDGGAAFTPAVHLSTYFTPGNGVNRAQMAVDAAGLPHLVWDGSYNTAIGGTNYHDADVFYRRFDPQAPALSNTNLALDLKRDGFSQTTASGGLRRDNLQIPNAPVLAFSNAMTVELWVRPATNCGLNASILLRESAADPNAGAYQLLTRGYSPYGEPAPRYPKAFLLTTNGRVELNASTELKDNVWHHLALTYDASTNTQNARLYVDGRLEASANATGLLDARGGIVWVGRPTESDYFVGSVDEIRFWNRALTPPEIIAGLTSRLTGTESGLAAYYPLDGSTRERTGHAPDGVLMYQETFGTWTVPSIAPPTITGPALTGGQLNRPFVWKTGADYYSSLTALGLPSGLTLGLDGLITGTPTAAGVFDALLTASNVTGTATQTLRIVINGSATVLWREDFNNGLEPGWGTVPSDTSYYSFSPGLMRLRANNGDTWNGFNRTINLFAINAPGTNDWTATLGVTTYDANGTAYNSLHVVAWKDYDNNVRLDYGYGHSGGIASENAGVMAAYGNGPDFAARPFLLRLIKQGNACTGFYSTNGVDFLPIATNVMQMTFVPTQIGFWMGVDPSYANIALLDYFEVTTNAPADQMPFITSAVTATGQVRVTFSYPITANNHPTSFGAANLPVGLQVNSTNGLISGVPLVSGSFNVTLSATNTFGSASTNLLLQIAPPVPLAASTVLQPSGGANDGTDDGSATKGKDRSQIGDASGSSPVLYLYNSSCNVGLQPAYLQFAVSPQPTQDIAKAEVAVYCKMFFNGSGWAWPAKSYQISLRRVTASWNELTLPASVAATPLASQTVTAVGGGTPGFVEFEGWLTFDITALYRDWASGAAANYGVQLAIDTPYCANGNEFWVYSSDNTTASLRPKLTVETSLQPTLTITPSAGNAVLGWSTLSNAIYQVQSSDSLSGWTAWGDPFLGRGGPTNIVVPRTPANQFFRVGVQ